MHQAKYVVIEREGHQHAVLFPLTLQHRDMVPLNAERVISAGFYQIIDAETLLVYGASMSLHVGSRSEDADLIKRLLTNN